MAVTEATILTTGPTAAEAAAVAAQARPEKMQPELEAVREPAMPETDFTTETFLQTPLVKMGILQAAAVLQRTFPTTLRQVVLAGAGKVAVVWERLILAEEEQAVPLLTVVTAVRASSSSAIRWRQQREETCRWDEGCEAGRVVRTLERDGPFRAA
jgi:hypothetical protein